HARFQHVGRGRGQHGNCAHWTVARCGHWPAIRFERMTRSDICSPTRVDAHRHKDARGIWRAIGRFIAGKIGATFKPVNYPTPQAYEASFGKNQWDIALGPRVLAPADKADVTPDVWLIEFPADAIELLRGGKANVFGADAGLIAAIAGGY